MQNTVEVIDGPEAAASMLQSIRLRLLGAFREPASAAAVARRFDLPRQRLGHHVRALEDAGLLRQVGERRTGNFVERLLQSSARGYVIAPQALGEVGAGTGEVRDRFSCEYLLAAAAGILRQVASLRRLADRQGKRVPTLTLETEVNFRDPRAQAAFAEDLAGCLADLVARYHHDGDGRRFRFTIAGHPALGPVTDAPEENEDESQAH